MWGEIILTKAVTDTVSKTALYIFDIRKQCLLRHAWGSLYSTIHLTLLGYGNAQAERLCGYIVRHIIY